MGSEKRASLIHVGNIKGGVGKTACSLFTAYLAASEGKKVLMVDSDPATCGLSLRSLGADSMHLLKQDHWGPLSQENPIPMEIVEIAPSIDLVPGDMGLIDRPWFPKVSFDMIRPFVEEAKRRYDCIVVDGGVSDSLMEWVFLKFADTVVVPIHYDFASFVGLMRVSWNLIEATSVYPEDEPVVFEGDCEYSFDGYVYAVPWGMKSSKQTQKIRQTLDSLLDKLTINLLPECPWTPQMTDILSKSLTMDKFLATMNNIKKKDAFEEFIESFKVVIS